MKRIFAAAASIVLFVLLLGLCSCGECGCAACLSPIPDEPVIFGDSGIGYVLVPTGHYCAEGAVRIDSVEEAEGLIGDLCPEENDMLRRYLSLYTEDYFDKGSICLADAKASCELWGVRHTDKGAFAIFEKFEDQENAVLLLSISKEAFPQEEGFTISFTEQRAHRVQKAVTPSGGESKDGAVVPTMWSPGFSDYIFFLESAEAESPVLITSNVAEQVAEEFAELGIAVNEEMLLSKEQLASTAEIRKFWAVLDFRKDNKLFYFLKAEVTDGVLSVKLLIEDLQPAEEKDGGCSVICFGIKEKDMAGVEKVVVETTLPYIVESTEAQ